MNPFYILTSDNDMIHWEAVTPLFIDSFPWYQSGEKQKTEVKVVLAKDVLHIKVHATDKHSSATELGNNGPVYLDSCFEFFVKPEDTPGDGYINFEINCIGSLYLAYNYKGIATEATDSQIEQVKIRTSLPYKTIKEVQKTDEYWTLDIEIPLSLIQALYPNEVSTTCWYGNFYRCGGVVDDQYGMWKEMTDSKPNFHLPKQFGKLPIDK